MLMLHNFKYNIDPILQSQFIPSLRPLSPPLCSITKPRTKFNSLVYSFILQKTTTPPSIFSFKSTPPQYFAIKTLSSIIPSNKKSQKMGWGVSRLILLKATVYFMLFLYLRSIGLRLISIPFLYASLIAVLVSIASHPYINLPMLLGKRTDGSFPIWSVIIFSPFLCFVWMFSMIRRFVSKEEAYSEICDGVYVGGWPCNVSSLPPGNPAIIDCTCEFPRKSEFVKNAYMCVPTWDTRAPSPSEIESAVKWACRKRAQGVPIFIHCAYGHGRSVAVMCALLVALGVVDDWKNAEKMIQKQRPYIRMNSLHRKALEEWGKHRLSPIKRNSAPNLSSVLSDTTPGAN